MPASTQPTLPDPPNDLAYGQVRLRFDRIVPGDAARGLVPFYHFRILAPDGSDAGHINFRVGDTEHVRLSAGHVGFEIRESIRGRHYALQACKALAPFIRSIYGEVTITCDPANAASRRTIEALPARFIDEIEIPPHDPQYEKGARRKRRYIWRP